MLRKFVVICACMLLALLPGGCVSAEAPGAGMIIVDDIGGDGEASSVVPLTDEPSAEPQESSDAQDEPVEIIISAGGDVTLGGNRKGNPSSTIYTREFERQGRDYGFPFRNVREILSSDDVTIMNFEGTFTTSSSGNGNTYQFRVDSEHVEALTGGSVEMVTIENNHIRDFGQQGFDDTTGTLDANGIAYACEGHLATYNVKGVTVGMLAYQTFNGGYERVYARLDGDIAAAREACDIVIVYYHWGEEKDYKPNSKQIALGRATADAGADLVLGSHSHRINPIELYKGKYIVYSLSNFSFSGNSMPSDMDTFLFQVKLNVSGGTVEAGDMRIIPMRISSRTDTNDFAPTPYKEGSSAARKVVDRMIKEGKNLDYALRDYQTEWK